MYTHGADVVHLPITLACEVAAGEMGCSMIVR